MHGLYESGENYLETILILKSRGLEVRSIDIVREMNLSKPSVSRAMKILKEGGFINIDADGFITLTENGTEVAERIYERHRVLTDWLIGIGVNEKTAAEDACKVEHDLSEETFEKIHAFVAQAEKR